MLPIMVTDIALLQESHLHKILTFPHHLSFVKTISSSNQFYMVSKIKESYCSRH